MEKILSQAEVDALLRGLSEGQPGSEHDRTSDDGIQNFDLINQDRIVRGRMPTLEIINDRFAKLFRSTMSSGLRKVLDVTVTQTEMVKFGEFIRTLPVPTSLHILKMEPLRGHVLLVIESRLVFNLLDCFFGGTGKTTIRIEGRDFTAIEQKVIQRFVQMVLHDLELAWKPVIPVNFQFSRSEINPQFATIAPPTELIIAVRYDLELDYLIGKITLCLPYSTIEPVRSKLYARYQSEQLEVDQEWFGRLKRQLREVEVDFLVELGKGRVTARELLQINAGDTLVLEQKINEPLVVQIEGVPKFRAFAGTSKGNQVVKILKEIE